MVVEPIKCRLCQLQKMTRTEKQKRKRRRKAPTQTEAQKSRKVGGRETYIENFPVKSPRNIRLLKGGQTSEEKKAHKSKKRSMKWSNGWADWIFLFKA